MRRLKRAAIPAALILVVLASCGRDSPQAPEGVWFTTIGSGPIQLVVLHGGPGLTHRYLRPEWDSLSDTARITYYDQRGCGRSERTDSLTWERHVEDLESIVNSLDDDVPLVLAGSSWGSILAVLYAYRHPGRAAALILSGVPDLSGTFLPVRSVADSTALRPVDSTTVAAMSTRRPRVPRVTVSADRPLPVQDSAATAADTAVIPAPLAARMGMSCPSAMAAVRSRFNETVPRLADLAVIDVPVLILRGQEATAVGDGSDQLAEVLSAARVETVEGAKHDPWFERPEAFFGVVRDFLRQVTNQETGT